jgi:hypothetical protein
MHLTDNQTKVRDALPADATATPADVAEATGLAYSTVTRLLRELAEIGAAVKDTKGWRHADPANAAQATDETTTDAAPADATADAEPAEPAEADLAATDEPDETEPDETEAEVERGEPDHVDDSTPDDLTGHAEEADETDTPADEPESAEDSTPVQVHDDETDGSQLDAAVEVAGDSETAEQDDAAADAPGPRQPRMSKGQLQDRVLVALRAATEPLGPTQLSKVLDGKSQGAISNACDRLVERGEAVLVNERPRRFEATRTT